MAKDKLSITELSCAIHERHPYSSERRETKFGIPKIIEALLGMAERGELPVSFTNGSDPGAVHTSLAGTPYKAKKGAAQAAKTRNDLQSIHYAIVSIDGGWGIQDVTAGFDDWFEYSVDKENKKDDEGNISDEGFHALGETMLVTGDDWSSFEKGRVFQDWIRDNAPPTEEQVEEFWPGSPKAKPGGLTREAQRRGGRQPKFKQGLQEAVNRFRKQISGDKEMLTLPILKDWIRQNASYTERYSFEPPIPNCDELYIDGPKLVWTDRHGRECDMALKSLERYISRANVPDKA